MPAEEHDEKKSASYFLISVSTRENLELCIAYRMAGFPGGESGAWTFCEINEGDFVSFLYGARAYGLYRVSKREAIADAERVPPWKPLTFAESGKTYSFPYRLHLEAARTFVEPIARTEFFYVAENLLLRGGYRKTHFQADQTTLQSVSQMGKAEGLTAQALGWPTYSTFVLQFTQNRAVARMPEICRFREVILQAAIRRYLSAERNLNAFVTALGLHHKACDLEVLGEKALAQGHIDLLLKERIPLGSSIRIPIEVKTKKGQLADIDQLQSYITELGKECPFGVLLAADFPKATLEKAVKSQMKLVRYKLDADLSKACTFDEIWRGLSLVPA